MPDSRHLHVLIHIVRKIVAWPSGLSSEFRYILSEDSMNKGTGNQMDSYLNTFDRRPVELGLGDCEAALETVLQAYCRLGAGGASSPTDAK